MEDRKILYLTFDLLEAGFTRRQIMSIIMDTIVKAPTLEQIEFLLLKGFTLKVVENDD